MYLNYFKVGTELIFRPLTVSIVKYSGGESSIYFRMFSPYFAEPANSLIIFVAALFLFVT